MVVDEQGFIDEEASDDTLYVTIDGRTVSMATANILTLEGVDVPQGVRAARVMEIERRYEDRYNAETIPAAAAAPATPAAPAVPAASATPAVAEDAARVLGVSAGELSSVIPTEEKGLSVAQRYEDAGDVDAASAIRGYVAERFGAAQPVVTIGGNDAASPEGVTPEAEQSAGESTQGVAPEAEQSAGESTQGVAPKSVPQAVLSPAAQRKAKRAEIAQRIPGKGNKKLWTQAKAEDVAEYIATLTDDAALQQATADKYIAAIREKQEKMDAIEALELEDDVAFWNDVKARLAQPVAVETQTEEGATAQVPETIPTPTAMDDVAVQEAEESTQNVDSSISNVDSSTSNVDSSISNVDSSTSNVDSSTSVPESQIESENGNENQSGEDVNEASNEEVQLSDEIDENGRQFVLNSKGEIVFGEIAEDTGLTPAPILLSEGLITNPATNDGYGLVHIEARHGEQIRNAGYNSVVDFVEEVAKNYERIREGINRDGHQTYMLQLTDKHNNTLMVELSGDGTYWNINTAGIFKTSYGKNRKEVYNRHTTAKQSTETVEESQDIEQSGTQTTSGMNTPTTSSTAESTTQSSNVQENSVKSGENTQNEGENHFEEESESGVRLTNEVSNEQTNGLSNNVDDNVENNLKNGINELNLQQENVSNNGNKDNTPVGGQVPESVPQGEHGEVSSLLGGAQETAARLRERIATDGRASQTGVSRDVREVENRVTREYAKENGLWIPFEDVFKLGYPSKSGNEHDTYLNAEQRVIYKVNNRMNTPSILDLLDRMEQHNKLFPNSKYSLVGFTAVSENGDVWPVFAQDYVPDARMASIEEIDGYMSALGFTRVGDGRYSNGGMLVKDLKPRNVLVNENGDVFVVDAEFEAAEQESGENRSQISENSENEGEKDVIEEMREQNRVAEERQQRAGVPPRPSDYATAFINGDANAQKAWEDRFNDYLDKLTADDLSTVDSTISSMQGNKEAIKAGNPAGYMENPKYKAFDNIEKMLKKRKRELEKSSTNEEKRQDVEEKSTTGGAQAEQTENANLQTERQTEPTISQESEQVSDQDNAPYTITPAQYTTKKGKVLDMHLVKFAGTLTKEQQRAAKELAKAEKGWYDREQGGFMMRSEESAKQLADTILNNDDAVSDAQPVSMTNIQALNDDEMSANVWEAMSAQERMDFATEHPITIEEAEKSSVDDVNKYNAIAYIRGTNNLITQLSYLKVYEDVRIRPANAAPINGGRSSAQLAETDNREDADRRTGGESRDVSLPNGEDSGREIASNTDGREDSARKPDSLSGEESNREVLGGESSMVGVSADGGDVGGGGTDRRNGGDGRRGRRTDGVGNTGGDADRTVTSDVSIDDELNAALEGFKEILSDFSRAGRETLNLNIVGLNNKQLELLPQLISRGTRVGYILLKKGFLRLNEWARSMKSYLGTPLHDAGLSDAEVDAFINELWNSNFPIGDEVHTIAEWASIIGMEETRKAVRASIVDKKAAQDAAENIEVKIGDMNNIAESLPFLLPQQQEDVLKAETQFFDESHNDREHAYGKGYMFTNGTGTGKTYTGLGIVKRFIKQGKKRILIVTPSQQKVSDWINDAKNLNVELRSLDDFAKEQKTTATQTAGEGAIITTYANFRENKALLEDVFDLVVYDESHRLLENKQGIATQGARQHYMVTNRNADDAFLRLREVNPLYQALLSAQENFIRVHEETRKNNPQKNVPLLHTSLDEEYKKAYPELYRAKSAYNKAESAWIKEEQKLKEQAKKDATVTKVVFLSATPFNTRDNLDYAEQYIFSYPEEDMNTVGSYKHQSPRTRFYLEHFGGAYKFRYGRLENAPQNADVVARQEIAFSDYLQKQLNTMSGRVIDSEFDYSRDFPTVSLEMGERINSAIGSITEDEVLRPLWNARNKVWFNYNYSSALFETIKISAMIPRLKQHLESGRKVVIFHRRVETKEPIIPPFKLMMDVAERELKDVQKDDERKKLSDAIRKFKRDYADLFEWEQTLDYRMPREQLADVFGRDNILFFSGKESTKVKNESVKQFNDDNSGKNIIVIQEASGKEGISLHDRTGAHQRVVVTLALPQSPITALQIEGRIYRIGNKSNAVFEYPILGLNSEIVLFGQNFNKSVSTTENLALGSQARNLRDSFARGIEERSGDIPIDEQGVGGKEADAADVTVQDPFDNAVLDYYTNQKITARRDNREGKDYYPTPEPLGFMMNQWGRIKEGDEILEPSAGHGAIARYAPTENRLTAIEPSQSLFARLQIKAGSASGRDFVNDIFENYNTINKHDVVLMNPPFGVQGKLAAEHVAKAYKHLNEGGRIVAIVPEGKAQERIGKWLDEQKDAVVVGEVLLPDVTFVQAGTSIRCRVLVIDKISNETKRNNAAAQKVTHNLDYVDTVEDFFEALRGIGMPDRTIDTKLIMQKRAKRYAGDLRSIKGVKEVFVDNESIIIRSNGWRRFGISWGDFSGDALKQLLANQYKAFAKKIPYADETSQEIMRESQSIICKLANMTEDEMERYIDNRNESSDDIRFRMVAESERQKPFHDMIDDLYSNGNVDKSKYARTYFYVAETPAFMANIGLAGAGFTIPFKAISTHIGKDADHKLTADIWHELPNALQHPFLVTKYGEDGRFRIYTTLLHNGKYVAVGVDVKRINQGRNKPIVEINSIKTVFAKTGRIGENETVVCYDERITPEQEALLDGRNFRQYPTIQELSTDKDSNNISNLQEDDNDIRYRAIDVDAEAERTDAEITAAVERLSAELNTPVEIVTNLSTSPDGRKRASKGWYEGDRVYLVLPNAESVQDAVETVLHEVVGHRGLRALFGERFDAMLDDVFTGSSKAVRSAIMERALPLIGRGRDNAIRVATEEYMAEQAERGCLRN